MPDILIKEYEQDAILGDIVDFVWESLVCMHDSDPVLHVIGDYNAFLMGKQIKTDLKNHYRYKVLQQGSWS